MYTKSGSSTSAPMRTNPNKNIHTPQTMYTMYTPTKKRRYFGLFCCVHYFFSMYTHVHSVHTNVHTGEEKAVAVYILGCCVHSPMYTDRPATRSTHQTSEKCRKYAVFCHLHFKKWSFTSPVFYTQKWQVCTFWGRCVHVCTSVFFDVHTKKRRYFGLFRLLCTLCTFFLACKK